MTMQSTLSQGDTMSGTLTDKQRKGMIAFHERAAKAYILYGQTAKAKAAQAKADALKKGA